MVRREGIEPYGAAGYDLIPLHPWNYVDGRGRDRGKSPRDPLWRRREYGDDAIEAAVDAGDNVGVRLQGGQMVIDYDPRNDPLEEGIEALRELVGTNWLDRCPRVNTGSGGVHWYCTKPADARLRNAVGTMPGVEFKSLGRQVVAAGSRHPCGEWYEWDDFSPPLGAAPEAPASLLQAAARPGAGSDQGEAGELGPDQLARLLSQLDPRDYRDHDAWLEVGMAAHHATGGRGLAEFLAWSTSDEHYAGHGPAIEERWPTWAADPGGPAVTVRTLFHHVADAGGSLRGLYADLFPDPEDDDEPLPPGAVEEPAEDDRRVGPDAPLWRMNDRFVVVPEGSDTFVYRTDGGTYQRMKVRAFKDLLAGEQIEREGANGPAMRPIADAWMRWPHRRTARGIAFAPEGAPEGYLNTWTGWAVEPDPSKEWRLLEELVREVMASGCRESAEYVLDWCAYMMQHPGSPGEVALVFQGMQGTGKSTFGRVLEGIAGDHGARVSHGLTRNFNAFLRDCVFLFADEAFWAGDKAAESQLKSMITERSLLFEAKGVDASMAPNCLHLCIASNARWVVPAALQGERRFAFFEVSDCRRGDFGWWDALNAELEAGAAAGFAAHLLGRDLGSWHPRRSIPAGSGLAYQKLQSLGPVDMWWFSALKAGSLPAELGEGGEQPEWEDGPVTVTYRSVQAGLERHMGRGPGTMRAVTTQLGMRLGDLVPGLRRRRLGTERAYVFPDLPTCRRAFEALLGGSLNWDL